jgi:hypothetical protein
MPLDVSMPFSVVLVWFRLVRLRLKSLAGEDGSRTVLLPSDLLKFLEELIGGRK